MEPRFITFTSDFGISDHFVGVMKGVVYNINPLARVVDISHEVPSYDPLDGALTIAQAYSYFPPKTIHVVVVDPGVGSARRPILARSEKHFFVAPDNGVLSLALEREHRASVRHITAENYFLHPVSQTFHGRDVFAAVAGWLSTGLDCSDFGQEISDYVRFSIPAPKATENGIQGVILKVDKFGNLITNIAPQDLPQLFAPHPTPFKIVVGKRELTNMRNSYAAGPAGEPFAILGSMGFLEIAMNQGSAARALQVGKGTEVVVSSSA